MQKANALLSLPIEARMSNLLDEQKILLDVLYRLSTTDKYQRLGFYPINNSQLRKECGMGSPKLNGAISFMLSNGFIIRRTGRKKGEASEYTLVKKRIEEWCKNNPNTAQTEGRKNAELKVKKCQTEGQTEAKPFSLGFDQGKLTETIEGLLNKIECMEQKINKLEKRVAELEEEKTPTQTEEKCQTEGATQTEDFAGFSSTDTDTDPEIKTPANKNPDVRVENAEVTATLEGEIKEENTTAGNGEDGTASVGDINLAGSIKEDNACNGTAPLTIGFNDSIREEGAVHYDACLGTAPVNNGLDSSMDGSFNVPAICTADAWEAPDNLDAWGNVPIGDDGFEVPVSFSVGAWDDCLTDDAGNADNVTASTVDNGLDTSIREESTTAGNADNVTASTVDNGLDASMEDDNAGNVTASTEDMADAGQPRPKDNIDCPPICPPAAEDCPDPAEDNNADNTPDWWYGTGNYNRDALDGKRWKDISELHIPTMAEYLGRAGLRYVPTEEDNAEDVTASTEDMADAGQPRPNDNNGCPPICPPAAEGNDNNGNENNNKTNNDKAMNTVPTDPRAERKADNEAFGEQITKINEAITRFKQTRQEWERNKVQAHVSICRWMWKNRRITDKQLKWAETLQSNMDKIARGMFVEESMSRNKAICDTFSAEGEEVSTEGKKMPPADKKVAKMREYSPEEQAEMEELIKTGGEESQLKPVCDYLKMHYNGYPAIKLEKMKGFINRSTITSCGKEELINELKEYIVTNIP